MGRKLLFVVICLAVAAPGAAHGTGSATTLAGKWVAKTPAGTVVLTLHKAGTVWKGTYVRGGKKFKAVAKGGNADGAGQITLTLTPGRTSSMCGLQGSKLYCSLATGTAVFSHA